MVDLRQFERIKEKYGHYASWAVWADEGKRPKDNMGDISVLDVNQNTDLLQQLNPIVILVALNISRPILVPLGNFHDARPQAMDFKIRYALRGTPYWGAYMTDIIKDFEDKSAGKVMSYLRAHRAFEEENVNMFREEIANLGVAAPTIITFGRDAYSVVSRHFKDDYKIIGISHYSNYGSKEKYREEVTCNLTF